MKTGKNGVELIKEFEGYESKAYPDPGTGGDPWTIGYGTTRINDKPVKPGMTCTKEQAEKWLKADLKDAENSVEKLVTVEITQNQFDALVSFVYNVGAGALKKSTLLKKLNNEDYEAAAEEFKKWNKAAGRILAGLTRRRNAERELFLSK